jgi:hypothetical protein
MYKNINRSYTVSDSLDDEHIINGRCPNYALNWGEKNKHHWSIGHDYFIGNGMNINDGTKELREILSKRNKNGMDTKNIIFCDLDGVLADFEQGIINKFKKNVEDIKPSLMWYVINSSSFFETLPWMKKGRELWSRIEKYNPIILTGLPRSSSSAVDQKIRWCKRELGENIQVVTCSSKEKPNYSIHNYILIDDRKDNLNAWNNKGGKFVLYNEDDLDAIVERIDKHMENIWQSP